jgi:hypothetical protein
MPYHIKYLNEELLSDGTTYTWDGTETVVATGTITHLTVGRFIRLNSDTGYKYFEVTAIDGQDITITDPGSLGIPTSTGAEACSLDMPLTQTYPQSDSGMWIEECAADPGHTPRLCHVEDAAVGDKVWLSCCPPEVNPHPVAGTLYPKEITEIEVI